MNLFGLTLPVFIIQFQQIFCIEYIRGIIRIRDLETKSCIINCKLPIIIGKTNDKLLHSLYICIFKYECEYDTKDDVKLYRQVKQCINAFINDVYIPRKNLNVNVLPLVMDCMLDAAHSKYHQQPSYSLTKNVKQLCKKSTKINAYNTFAIDGYHQACIYVVS